MKHWLNPIARDYHRDAFQQEKEMDDIDDTAARRRENVRRLMKTSSPTALAKHIGVTQSMISQIAGPTPSRPIGEKQARNIEKKLALPKGWLDEDHDNGKPLPPTVPVISMLEEVQSAFEELSFEPPVRTFVAACRFAYHHLQGGGQLDHEFLQQLATAMKHAA